MHELTGFQRDILFVIAGLDGPHGLAIKDELDSYYASESEPLPARGSAVPQDSIASLTASAV